MTPFPHPRLLAAAVYIALNVIAIRFSIAFGPHLEDWQLWASLPDRLAAGDVYVADESGPPFVWSPVAAWIMAGVALVGYLPWVVAHFLVLPLLGGVGLVVLTLGSWAFWWDAASAHTMTFVLVAGVLALCGSRVAAIAYLALLLLMPRPSSCRWPSGCSGNSRRSAYPSSASSPSMPCSYWSPASEPSGRPPSWTSRRAAGLESVHRVTSA